MTAIPTSDAPAKPEKRSTEEVIGHLNTILADAVVFYYKLHHYHWNVRGAEFYTLHATFEDLYTRWATMIDDVAERILSVGGAPIGSLKGVIADARLNDETETPDALTMVSRTIDDLRHQRERIRRTIELADDAGDRGTANLLDGPNDAIDKDIWMLTAFLG